MVPWRVHRGLKYLVHQGEKCGAVDHAQNIAHFLPADHDGPGITRGHLGKLDPQVLRNLLGRGPLLELR